MTAVARRLITCARKNRHRNTYYYYYYYIVWVIITHRPGIETRSSLLRTGGRRHRRRRYLVAHTCNGSVTLSSPRAPSQWWLSQFDIITASWSSKCTVHVVGGDGREKQRNKKNQNGTAIRFVINVLFGLARASGVFFSGCFCNTWWYAVVICV